MWGILDLCSVGWFIGWRMLHGQIPFFHDIIKSLDSTSSFGIPSLSIITVFSLILHVSLIFSGVYLIKHHKVGALLSYVQTPFRILFLIPPSIFFIIWPLKYIFKNHQSIWAISTLFLLVFMSEALKLYCVVNWRGRMVVA